MSENSAENEIKSGDRFAFGENWSDFLRSLNEERIGEAEKDLKMNLERENLNGKRFLDIGSGSGIHSLAAMRLGAEVVSFDYDTKSVACALELKRRYFADDDRWRITEGNALDAEFLASLGTFDIVYSWGVLHHTGDMYKALALVAPLVAGGGGQKSGENGKLFLSIYNDQGIKSKIWRVVKRAYVKSPAPIKKLMIALALAGFWCPIILLDFLRLKPFERWKNYVKSRGMSPYYDVVDWIGGYPFEVAKPEEIFYFFRDRGFVLRRLFTCAGKMGCNQFVFDKP
ncbi:MAG: class I SAM-dependent methyltransferase [Helicobacteraceae bacterium]|jgi:2-polyprenyl-6-hydroxyphenyl methylase/3-demethylubiquinone-9 3-methyltransferase|nr:class I SAM-dependent methyltransferase [Helicobacteraceae bacterium]